PSCEASHATPALPVGLALESRTRVTVVRRCSHRLCAAAPVPATLPANAGTAGLNAAVRSRLHPACPVRAARILSSIALKPLYSRWGNYAVPDHSSAPPADNSPA